MIHTLKNLALIGASMRCIAYEWQSQSQSRYLFEYKKEYVTQSKKQS